MSDCRVVDLIRSNVQTKLINPSSQVQIIGYLNSTRMLVMVTAAINANVREGEHSDIPKIKNLEANRG